MNASLPLRTDGADGPRSSPARRASQSHDAKNGPPQRGGNFDAGSSATHHHLLADLYRTEAPRLLRFFQRRTGNSDSALDMVQEAFLRLVRSPMGSRLENPAPYLQRIARNLLFDRAKRTETKLAAFHMPFDEEFVAWVEPEQELELEAHDLLKRYEHALAELSDKTRAVFLLHRVQGCTYNEIRIRLGVSLGTVEYHMGRALAHFDRVLGE